MEEERRLHNLSWSDYFEGECHEKVLQKAGPGHLVAVRDYITFLEYLVALEEDTKANAHYMSTTNARAQRARNLLATIDAEAAAARDGNRDDFDEDAFPSSTPGTTRSDED